MSSNHKDVIEFNNKVGATTRQRGIKVGDSLCVSYSSVYSTDSKYKIYSIASGKPVTDLEFDSLDAGIEFADFLDKVYGDYWVLLEEYPRMDIPQVCMWTVPDGIRTFVALTSLRDKDTITLADMERAYAVARDDDYLSFPHEHLR